jgi:hypothetical protein
MGSDPTLVNVYFLQKDFFIFSCFPEFLIKFSVVDVFPHGLFSPRDRRSSLRHSRNFDPASREFVPRSLQVHQGEGNSHIAIPSQSKKTVFISLWSLCPANGLPTAVGRDLWLKAFSFLTRKYSLSQLYIFLQETK